MKNWFNTFSGTIVLISATLLASEFVFSHFLEDTIVALFAPGEEMLEFLHIVAETVMMAPLLYFLVFRRIEGNANSLRESNEKIEEYLRFFTLSIDPMGIADPFGRFKQVNPAFLKLTGYSNAEITSKPFLDFVAPEDREATTREMKQQVTIGSSLNFENHYVCKDGKVILLSWNAFYDKKSGVTYATARDITEKRKLEDSLAQSESHLRILFNTIPDLIWIKDAGGIYLGCNPMFERFFGKKEAEIIGKTDYDFVDNELGDLFRENDTRAMESGKPAVNEEWITFADDGHRALLETIKTPVYKGDGTLFGVLGIARDITERKDTENKLAEISGYTRSLIEASLDPLVTISPEGKITDVNKETEQVTGINREELIGTDFANYFTEHEKAREGYQKVFAEGSVVDYPLSIKHRDGHTTDVLYNATVYKNEKGDVLGVFAAARDITERKKSEEKYKTLIEKIKVAVVVHNKDTRILITNTTAQELLGLTAEGLYGKVSIDPEWNFHREDMSPMPLEEHPVNQVIAKKATVSNLTMGIHRPRNTDDVWVLVNADPVFDEQGEVSQIIVTFTDITEQKNAQQELSRSEHGLTEAQRMAHLGSWELDLVKNKLSWSEENYRIFGFENTKFGATYEAFLETVHPDDRDMVNKAYTESVASHIPYNIDHRLQMKDGTVKYVNERCETFYDESGNPVRSIGTTYDITENKLAEQKIQRLSSLYATLSLCNQAIVHSNNKEELFMQVCRAGVLSGGFKMAWVGLVDHVNKTISPAYSYGDDTGYLNDIHVSIKDDTPYGHGPTGTSVRENRPYWCQDFKNDPNTIAWREAGNRAGWGSSAALPLYEKGTAVGAITLYTSNVDGFDEPARNLLMEMSADISFALDNFIDRAIKNELEGDLAEGKVQDEAIMASLGEGMIAMDKRGRVITMNRSAEKITGRGADEIIGTNISDSLPAVYEDGTPIPKEKRPVSIVLESGTTSTSDMFYYVHKNGEKVPVSVTVTPVLLRDEMIGAVEVFRDTTHEKELEETRRDLLSLASHQLRTPLSGTKWLIETLKRGIHGPLTQTQEEYLDELYKINDRMTTLVQDMLGVLRMESGTVPVKTTKISTSGVVATLLENFSPAAKSKLITLESEEEADFVIETDQALLQSILDSLISNAITYSPPGKTVLVSTKKIDSNILFSVKDLGIGIPKNEQAQVYDRFYRASNAKTFNTKGTGLGLYIAATLAKKIGATLSFESEEGKGTTFFVSVPYTTL